MNIVCYFFLSSWGLSKEFHYDIVKTNHEYIVCVCVCVMLKLLLCVLQILIRIYLFMYNTESHGLITATNLPSSHCSGCL